jgi:hypothetical protein
MRFQRPLTSTTAAKRSPQKAVVRKRSSTV